MSRGEGKKVSSEVCNILLALFSVLLLTIFFLSHYLMGSLSKKEDGLGVGSTVIEVTG